MNIKPTKVPAGKLLAYISRMLKTKPREATELAHLTGYSAVTIRWRLGLLEADGLAHHIHATDREGNRHIWFAGPAPDVPAPVPPRKTSKKKADYCGDKPRQRIVKSYPTVGRRDDLVAALFGAPARTGMLAGILGGEG